ncbi:YhgE/Pip family protein [Gordoniibacillus kamchatkensis]|uniref:YhgE/Pip family protein n=1 Tax=Gordoniibacillus kamchatkensis TaxID=1590651 RepID=UPI001E5057E2|nr:YhgE/Pip domain-containing protein [Paenibacillus sp. VKM B-2647]
MLADANKSIPDVERIVGDAAKGLAIGGQELAALQRDLPAAEAKVKSIADRIRELEKEGTLNELIDLLKINADKESDFFAEPVKLTENKLFPIPNYGSAMSPFFTTLSLWVGALLLVSLLTVEVHEPEAQLKSYQIYFGRYMTFGTLAVLQSVLVTAGDIWLLKAYVADKLPFIAFGMLLSAIFMLIVYTLVSVFGNVGKAMAIVLLVLQLAGSGGTFPIQVTPPFFQAIHPFLPFTYAISMMREAVGGILWDIVAKDVAVLLLFVGAALLIGLALKSAINRAAERMVAKAKESKLIH